MLASIIHDTVRGSGISISSHAVGFRGSENAIVGHNSVRHRETMGVLYHVRGSTEVDVHCNLILEKTHQGLRLMTFRPCRGGGSTAVTQVTPSVCRLHAQEDQSRGDVPVCTARWNSELVEEHL